MGPNETLEELRRLSREGVTDGTEWKSHFDALDEWITSGGLAPKDWCIVPIVL